MTKLQLQYHTFPLLLSPRTSKITQSGQSTNQGRPEGGGGARDFWGLFFCASNTRIRRFFRFCTFFGGVCLIRGCVLYAQIYGISVILETILPGNLKCLNQSVLSIIMSTDLFLCSVGGSMPVIFTYFCEFQPKHKRGSMISLLATFWMTGNIVAAGEQSNLYFH